jgi:signal transduction histidine kinase/CheY-like chemotaxis protein
MGIPFPPDDDPAPAPEIEALKREIERMRALDGPNRRMLEALLEESPHGIIVCAEDGRLVLQNRASETIWAGSASASSVAEWGRFRAFHPDGRPYAPEDWPMARCLATGEPTEPEEIRIERFDGTRGVLLGSCAPIAGDGGRPGGAISVFADITRFKREAAKARENLLAIVSHDLRNPLGAIVTSAALLQRRAAADPSASRFLRQLETILRSADRMDWLIRDLLDLARLDAGELILSRRPEDARSLAHESVERCRPLSEQKKLRVVTLVPDGLRVLVDRERMLQILSNLLGNAIKFSPEEGTVTLSAKAEAGRAHFTVEDLGPGIPDSEIPHLFDRYWKGPGGTRGGVGLGLSIVKALVEAHDGEVAVESSAGRGRRFSFTVALASEGARPGESRGVLVVDDDADMRGAVADVLADAGFPVATASNGEEALAALRSGRRPGVILLDLLMPVMNGFEFRKAQRNDPAFAAIPTVVISASAELDARRGELEGTEVLRKPVDMEALVALASRWCN